MSSDKQSETQGTELGKMRHSLAHIMATAVTTLWPEAKLGVGPVVEGREWLLLRYRYTWRYY